MRNANQYAEVKANFLRALKMPGGADVVVIESVTTGGTFDAARDQMVGATTTEKETLYPRHALLTNIKIAEDMPVEDRRESMAFSQGHELGVMGIGEVLVAKVRPELPLSPSFLYRIAGNLYKFDKILESRAFGMNKPLWNLVKFVRG